MRRDARDPVLSILAAGALAQGLVPWATLWLADGLEVEIPSWLLWPVLGAVPLTVAVVLLVHLTQVSR